MIGVDAAGSAGHRGATPSNPRMPGSDLAGLFDLATASDARSLHRLAAAAEQSVLGCSAANVATWRAGEPQLIASTHPDLPGLIDVEVQAGRGPVLAALAQAPVPVSCPDTLVERRWPEYAQAALTAGVRCSLTFAHIAGSDAMSLTTASLPLCSASVSADRSAPRFIFLFTRISCECGCGP